MSTPGLIRVALPVPLAEAFDYLWGDGPLPACGVRIRVPFGRSERVGIVLEHPRASSVAQAKLKLAGAALDATPLLGAELIDTLRFASEYYHHPIGEVLKVALPARLRTGAAPRAAATSWRLSPAGSGIDHDALKRRAPLQATAITALAAAGSATAEQLRSAGITAATLRRLAAKGWIEPAPRVIGAAGRTPAHVAQRPELTPDQTAVLAAIDSGPGGYRAYLLHGVTGSGKTEVYLRLTERELAAGRQTLLLVPEIALTPQLVRRLTQRFGAALAVLHSGLPARERDEAWQRAASGEAQLIVGTRSAIFAPLPRGGLIIVDEEHDASYKQQTGFKYSARDLAVARASRLDVPVLLASATPSLESFYNAERGRYHLLTMPRRIGAGGTPLLRVVDMNHQVSQQGLSAPLLEAMDKHLAAGNQVLLFLNRRGFAPTLFCPQCAQAEECANCDARLTVHASAGELRCHHCGAHHALRWRCPRCGAERIAVGAGTQRVSDKLKALYPDVRVARLDRDVTRQRGALDEVLTEVESGRTQILVGTQMLTKGHDFPRVTLVGILNADQGLFGTDFRSEERLAQSLLQVAGRAGRREAAGEVIIQTHHPGHPLLAVLQAQDYTTFAAAALAERRSTGWPPFSRLAVWRAEGSQRSAVFDFLAGVRSLALEQRGPVRVLGPAPAQMERREGRYRAHLLFECTRRDALHEVLARTLRRLREQGASRKIRWALDVDPIEL